jgi:hypothetical protein
MRILAIGAMLLMLAGNASAALVLTVNSYTTDQLSLSISGTFDQDTVGTHPGYLAIKNDWSNNQRHHTELFSSTPAIISSTITIDGVIVESFVRNLSSQVYADSIFFFGPGGAAGVETSILAGTAVSGLITLSGVGAFNPADVHTLELVSGWNDQTRDWVRFEASATMVPVPAAAWLFASGLGLLGWMRRR